MEGRLDMMKAGLRAGAGVSGSLILAIALAGPVAAQPSYVASDGHEYSLQCRRDGYVLKSLHPVSFFIEAGAASRVVRRNQDVIYLGKSCDAFNKVFGGGSWCWANGGFRAAFPQHTFGFPRQELDCDPPQDYEGRCGC